MQGARTYDVIPALFLFSRSTRAKLDTSLSAIFHGLGKIGLGQRDRILGKKHPLGTDTTLSEFGRDNIHPRLGFSLDRCIKFIKMATPNSIYSVLPYMVGCIGTMRTSHRIFFFPWGAQNQLDRKVEMVIDTILLMASMFPRSQRLDLNYLVPSLN